MDYRSDIGINLPFKVEIYEVRWSPLGDQILFESQFTPKKNVKNFFTGLITDGKGIYGERKVTDILRRKVINGTEYYVLKHTTAFRFNLQLERNKKFRLYEDPQNRFWILYHKNLFMTEMFIFDTNGYHERNGDNILNIMTDITPKQRKKLYSKITWYKRALTVD